MSTETTNKKIKIDNGTTFGKTYTDKAIDAKLPTDLIASANKLSLGVGNSALGNGVNLDGFTYDATTKTLNAKGGGGYNHYIVISDGSASNAIYLLIPSTNNLICSSLPELDTLLGTAQRFIQASGVVTDYASKLPIVAIKWQGSFSSSKIVTMSSEEATTKFTDISDVIETA